MSEQKHTCKTCVYERDSSPSQHCDGCVDGDCWRAAEPIKCPCAAYKGLVNLLRRVKNTLEPFPVVADIKSLKNTLMEARISEDEKVNVEKLHKKWQAKTRKLYRDIEQALKEQP